MKGGGEGGGRYTSGSDTKKGQYGANCRINRLETKNSTWQRNVHSYCTAIEGWTAPSMTNTKRPRGEYCSLSPVSVRLTLGNPEYDQCRPSKILFPGDSKGLLK